MHPFPPEVLARSHDHYLRAEAIRVAVGVGVSVVVVDLECFFQGVGAALGPGRDDGRGLVVGAVVFGAGASDVDWIVRGGWLLWGGGQVGRWRALGADDEGFGADAVGGGVAGEVVLAVAVAGAVVVILAVA